MSEPQPNTVHLPHTGLDVPYRLTVRNYADVRTSCGVAFAADVMHPELGRVGDLANQGSGGPTEFIPTDPTLFEPAAMEQFVERCRQGGSAVSEGLVFDYLITEAEMCEAVTTMRRDGLTIVREHQGPEVELPSIGSVMAYPRLAIRPSDRAELASLLNTCARVITGSVWQIYLGDRWSAPHEDTSEQYLKADDVIARRESLRAAAESNSNDAVRGWSMIGPMYDSEHNPFYELIENGEHLLDGRNAKTWCRCMAPSPRHRFERWTTSGVLVCAGTRHGCGGVHALAF